MAVVKHQHKPTVALTKDTAFIGFDLGKTTSAGIVKIQQGKPVLIDALSTDLSTHEPAKGKHDAKLAHRIDRLWTFMENVIGAYPDYIIGVEHPAQMRGKIAIGDLQSYFGVALLIARRSGKRFESFQVSEWKSKIGANVHFGSGTKQSVRAKETKQRILDVILELTGKDFGKNHDKADGVGIAIATAIMKGGLVV